MENLPAVENHVFIDLTKDNDCVVCSGCFKFCTEQAVQLCMRTVSFNCFFLLVHCVGANKLCVLCSDISDASTSTSSIEELC